MGDVERGTFSHRHAILHDQKTGERYCPLDPFARRLVSARTWTRLRTLVVRHLHRRRQDFPRLISRSRSKSLPMLLSNNACTHALFRTAAVIASTAGGGGE